MNTTRNETFVDTFDSIVTNLNTSVTYADLDAAYYDLGYIYPLEVVYLAVFLPATIVGLGLNVISVIILNSNRFNKPIFSYFIYTCLVGIYGNAVAIIHGFSTCAGYSLVPFANNYIAQWLEAYIYIPSYNMASYAKFLLDVAIILDRLIVFNTVIKPLMERVKPYQVFLMIIVFTVFINYPYIHLVYEPRENYLIQNGAVFVIYTVNLVPWGLKGSYGYVVMYSIYLFKHVLTLIVEIILNMISLKKFRSFIAKKNSLRMRTFNSTATTTHHEEFDEPPPPPPQSSRHQSASSKSLDADRNITKLVFLNTLASFLHHSILIVYVIYYLHAQKLSSAVRCVQLLAALASVLRHGANFFFFYGFNTNFRDQFHKKMMFLV